MTRTDRPAKLPRNELRETVCFRETWCPRGNPGWLRVEMKKNSVGTALSADSANCPLYRHSVSYKETKKYPPSSASSWYRMPVARFPFVRVRFEYPTSRFKLLPKIYRFFRGRAWLFSRYVIGLQGPCSQPTIWASI